MMMTLQMSFPLSLSMDDIEEEGIFNGTGRLYQFVDIKIVRETVVGQSST